MELIAGLLAGIGVGILLSWFIFGRPQQKQILMMRKAGFLPTFDIKQIPEPPDPSRFIEDY